jgi:hypothetical protein
MNRKTFNVNGHHITITETSPGRYFGNVNEFTVSGYIAPRGVHKAVLLSFLDDAGRAGAIDAETANWAEGSITTVPSRS